LCEPDHTTRKWVNAIISCDGLPKQLKGLAKTDETC
jgi:hypothetical protein